MAQRIARIVLSLARALGGAKRSLPTMGALALSIAGLAACHNAPLEVVDGVDFGRFQGRWYEIARLPRATQINCAGTTAFYKVISDRPIVAYQFNSRERRGTK